MASPVHSFRGALCCSRLKLTPICDCTAYSRRICRSTIASRSNSPLPSLFLSKWETSSMSRSTSPLLSDGPIHPSSGTCSLWHLASVCYTISARARTIGSSTGALKASFTLLKGAVTPSRSLYRLSDRESCLSRPSLSIPSRSLASLFLQPLVCTILCLAARHSKRTQLPVCSSCSNLMETHKFG